MSHLREFSLLLGKQAALAVPEQLTEVRSGRDLALQDYDNLPLPDQVLLDGLAAQCRAAAQRAQLMARTADIAEHLQLSLAASPLPFSEPFELAVHYAPGGDELEHVGGDWYDAVNTPSGTLAMVVGDVMGRGVLAATTMIRVRAGLRGLITVDPSPAHLLAFADELLVRDAPEQFVTAVAALLDPRERRVPAVRRRTRAGDHRAPRRPHGDPRRRHRHPARHRPRRHPDHRDHPDRVGVDHAARDRRRGRDPPGRPRPGHRSAPPEAPSSSAPGRSPSWCPAWRRSPTPRCTTT